MPSLMPSVGDPDGRLPTRPVRGGYRPVSRAPREGVHSADGTRKSVMRTPSAARRSRFGVLISRAPNEPRSPYPMSSARMRTMLGGPGGSVGEGDGAAATGVAGAAGEAPPQAARPSGTRARTRTGRDVGKRRTRGLRGSYLHPPGGV